MGSQDSKDRKDFKLALVGAAGNVGQPLALLLKLNPMITTLALHDKKSVIGVATDLSHVCTPANVVGYEPCQLTEALEDASIVVLAAGLPQKPGYNRDEQLKENGKMAAEVAKEICYSCPHAMVAIITNPINAIVPLVAKVLMDDDAHDPRRLFGVTTLGVVRAKTFIGESIGVDPIKVSIPVVGGHGGDTILALISQSNPKFDGTAMERMELQQQLQNAASDVVEAKVGKGTISLSMAYAGANFINSLLRAMNNEPNVIECAYVESDATEAQFFTSPVLLGPGGVVDNLGLPDLDEVEEEALEVLVKKVMQDIDKGLKLKVC
ncbi:hypothetical protein KR044_007389 [Drosophila immigrans]|nr:hypothetical protein KR044_007389 [Drosophila immigrans]